jgi:hypothetical protein
MSVRLWAVQFKSKLLPFVEFGTAPIAGIVMSQKRTLNVTLSDVL